ASGSASLVEIARTVRTLLEQKKIPPLQRTLHFLWVPEHFGTVAWLTKHPEVSARAIVAFNLDMVGEDLFKTNSRLNISRTPDSLPSFLNDLVENVAGQVEAAGLVSPNGSRHLFHWRMTPYSAGSDHDMFNDGNVRVPAVQFGHWPDWTHHTNEDSVDKADSTTLRRVGVLAAASAVFLATADDDAVLRLAGHTASAAFARIFGHQAEMFPAARALFDKEGMPDKKALEEFGKQTQHSKQVALSLGIYTEQAQRAVKSLEPLLSEKGAANLSVMSSMFEMIRTTMAAARKGAGPSEAPPALRRVPAKKYIGPIADGPSSLWFRQALGSHYAWWHEQELRLPHDDLIPRFALILYEAGNFADGKRSLAEIEDAVTAEYGELPAGLIEGIFDRLAVIGLVEWVEPSK
ncbi:MAG TPA: M28 family peptidase, partial [Candidatus Acidoferrales bacterium]|nr:M28 family peptidase [Candidatus Acidoferrales bacterium]